MALARPAARRCEFCPSTAVRRRSSTPSSMSSARAGPARPRWRAGASIASDPPCPTTPRPSTRSSTGSRGGTVPAAGGGASRRARRVGALGPRARGRRVARIAAQAHPVRAAAPSARDRRHRGRGAEVARSPPGGVLRHRVSRTLSAVAQRYALPERDDQAGLRRYGFHGLSYEYVVDAVGAAILGRAVLAHLGNGASMAAVRDGRSVDTTMGFSPTGGLVMGHPSSATSTPGLARPLAPVGERRAGPRQPRQPPVRTPRRQRDHLRRARAARRRERDPRAALALDVFTWSARKWVGAMAAAAGGLDTLVFTGGIGEHAPALQWRSPAASSTSACASTTRETRAPTRS